MAEEKAPGIWTVESSVVKDKDLELFENQSLADVVIKCGGRTWKLHKIILCTQSAWFKKALTGSFKESEAGIITLQEQEECDIDCFLRFIYTGSVDLHKAYPGHDAFVALMRIWKTADFFQNKILCDLAIRAAIRHARKHAQTLCMALERDDFDEEMENNMENSFNPAVRLLYQDEMQHLQPAFLPIYLNMALTSAHKLLNSAKFWELPRHVPRFAEDWTRALMVAFRFGTRVPQTDADDYCHECCEYLSYDGTEDTMELIRYSRRVVLCDECYVLPAWVSWKANFEE